MSKYYQRTKLIFNIVFGRIVAGSIIKSESSNIFIVGNMKIQDILRLYESSLEVASIIRTNSLEMLINDGHATEVENLNAKFDQININLKEVSQ